ncbi:MAG TPA: hypothetical protein VHF01_12245 [Candidatus Acidoferrum sp.]|nr:hypothetical protein [Candidatus Acidoferrum sp.]
MNQKSQIALLVVLLVVATLVWYFRPANPGVIADTAAFVQNYPPLAVDNPQLHWWKLEASRKAEYKSNGRNIFSPIAPPPPSPLPKPQPKPGDPNYLPPAPPPSSPPPTLPVKFFGYGTVPVGGTRRAFFTDGDEVYIVSEGETLLGRYRIIKIGNVNLEFEEISTGQRGRAVLEEQGPGA